MTRTKRKNIRKQTRRRNYKKRGGMLKQLARPLAGPLAKGLATALNSPAIPLATALNSPAIPLATALNSPAIPLATALNSPAPVVSDYIIGRPTDQPTIFNFNIPSYSQNEILTGKTTTDEIQTRGLVSTSNNILKIMKDNNITIDDLQKIINNETIVKSTEQAVEQAFANQGSVNWKEMRELQNQAYQAFTKINVFTHVWNNFVEDKCKTQLHTDQDKCFAIRGFVYILLMVSLIILKMVDSHKKKDKISENELANVVNTVVSGLVLDRILPTQLKTVIMERVSLFLQEKK
jgi:hypothetical protein